MFKEAIQNYLQQHNYMSFRPKAVFFRYGWSTLSIP
jgi:hypothetical protein